MFGKIDLNSLSSHKVIAIEKIIGTHGRKIKKDIYPDDMAKGQKEKRRQISVQDPAVNRGLLDGIYNDISKWRMMIKHSTLGLD